MLRLAICAATAALPLGFAAGPAQAATAEFPDQDGGGDTAITKVRVHNGAETLIIRLRHRVSMLDDRFWIDTRPADPGPEYLVGVRANSDYDAPLRIVESFTSGAGTEQPCPGIELHSDNGDDEPVSYVRIPQSCLSSPGKVRVASDSTGPEGEYDIAPNDGAYSDSRFTAWVALG